MFRRIPLAIFVASSALLPQACKSKEAARTVSTAPSAGANPEIKVIPDAAVAHALNPANEKPYSGAVGRVTGTVHASGDPPPSQPDVLAKIPRGKCEDARAFYAKLFREGPNRELGDVLVAVTGYKGFLPPPTGPKTVVIRGCSLESRTIALTFGQVIDVFNKGGEAFIPELVGSQMAALQVAIPGGEAVKLFPDRVGRYQILERSHEFARADVFVLKYPTVSVTGLDGKFSFDGIPVGEVNVSALLPATGQTAQQRVVIAAGETASVDFVLPYTAAPVAPASSAL